MSETNETETAPKAGGKPIIMAVVLVVGALVGGGAGAFFAGPLLAEKVLGPVDPTAASAVASDSAHADGKDAGHGKEGDQKHAAPAATHLIENLVLNPAQSGGTRFLMLSLSFDLADAAAAEQLKTRDAEVRDAVLTALGSKTVEQLADISARDTFKQEIIAAVAPLLSKGAVRQVFFPQFVIQ